MTEEFHNRRKYQRVLLEVEYSLKVGAEEYFGTTGNISLGGVYLQTLDPPLSESMLGEPALISLNLDGEVITTLCSIVFVGGYSIPYPEGVGIAFANEEAEELHQLSLFLVNKL